MKINMFLLDWLIVPVWCSIFALGGGTGTLIMSAVVLIFAILNTHFEKKTVRLVLVDINLMFASTIGIVLNNLLFIRFVYADRSIVNSMIVEIFAMLFYITVIMIISMTVRELARKKRRKIINRLAYDDDEDYYEDEEDDDFDEYYDDRIEDRHRRSMEIPSLKRLR